MRSAVSLARFTIRQIIPRSRLRPANSPITSRSAFPRFHHGSANGFSNSANRGRTVLWATAVALSPAAFIRLSEKDNQGTELTAEGRMLAASREEIEKKLDDDDHGISRFRHGIILYLDLYFWEPLCTTFRFLHLVVIFVPLIISVPALWLGSRNPKRDNERSGTLWWYSFLVKSMERAGPAFIKVYGNCT